MGEGLLELVEGRDEDALHARLQRRTPATCALRRTHLDAFVQEGEDVVVDAVFLAEVQIEAVAIHLRLGVVNEVLGDQDDEHVLLLAVPSQARVRLRVVGQEHVAQQREDHLGLAGAHLREVEALLPRDNAVQELFLLLGGDDLVVAVDESLVAGEVFTQDVDEFTQREGVVLVQIEELLLENGVVVRVRRPVQHVENGFAPRSRDLLHLLVLVIELEEDAGAAQVEEDEDEEGHVAHVHRHVEQVDQLLPTLHLQ
mmetsp:Transcript_42177/g.70384  ORF Transcript_42177/g.70384 Transcript_42177/m.70384 type:complete len:256 (-) Transcript_42177:2158-2925(-)